MNGRLQSEMNMSELIDRKLKDMPDYVGDWYINLKASRRTASTCLDYIRKVNLFLAYINKNVKRVKPSDITETNVASYFLSTQTKTRYGKTTYTSDSYQCTVWSCLDNFLGYLYKRGLIEHNYMEFIDKPKNHDLERINENRVLLTEDDFKKILASVEKEREFAIRRRDKAILLLFMNTGMRKAALINIMLDDIDFGTNELTIVDKGNKRHKYILTDQVCDVIFEWYLVRHEYDRGYRDNHLFLSKKGKMMSTTAVYNLVRKYTLKGIGKEVSPHKLRSGYCSILYNKTHDIEFVRRAVGHSNVQTTTRYIVVDENEKRKASEIMTSLL